MRAIDFANLKTGDMILDIKPKDKTNPACQYVVLCANGNNTATALNERGDFIHLNLLDSGEIELMNVRNLEYRTLTHAYHYTAAEAVNHDLARRVNGITTLHKMLSNPRNNHALNIEPVAQAAENILNNLTNERARLAGRIVDEVSDTWIRYYHTTTPAAYLLAARRDPFYNGLAQRTIEDMNTLNELILRITRAIETWKATYTTTITQTYSD